MRVMVNCMQMGQAAGTGAAMVGDDNVRAADAAELVARLREQGMPILDAE
jgi:hypothetical protein